jgi:hypothetical protein
LLCAFDYGKLLAQLAWKEVQTLHHFQGVGEDSVTGSSTPVATQQQKRNGKSNGSAAAHSKKQELFEAIPFELTGPITEVEHGGERLMQITGIMHRANEHNGNNRIHPAAILSREVARLQERLKSGDTVFSQADNRGRGEPHLEQGGGVRWAGAQTDH